MTGTEFSTAVEEINGGDPIASTLRFQFGNLGKNLIEHRHLLNGLAQKQSSMG
jgi:hypothetical protein